MVKKKEEKNKEILKQELVAPPENLRFPYNVPFKFASEDEEMIVITEADKFITSVEDKRNTYNLLEAWENGRNAYEGLVEEKDFPWDDSSNLWIHITSMTVDILKVKAKSQAWVEPAMVLKPLPGQSGEKLYNSIALKEKSLNYKVMDVSEADAENSLDPVWEDAINLGTGIAKILYSRKIDNDNLVLEIYESTKEDIIRFMGDFEKYRGTQEYKDYMTQLVGEGTEQDPMGTSTEVWMNADEVTKDGAEILYVKLEDLYVDPEIPKIEDQPQICEKQKYTWMDMVQYENSGFFNKGVQEFLKARYPKSFGRKDYDVVEVSRYYNLEKGKLTKIKFWYLKDEKKIISSITYPFMHRKYNYIPYYIKRRSDFFYGEGMAKRLKDTNKALNQLWNQVVDSGTWRNAPMLKAVENKFDPSVKKYGPATIMWLKNNINDLDVLNVAGVSANEVINLISRIERYAEWLTGVTAYMTGRESPLDPNAPMGKAYMLLKESNLRIGDFIKSLHHSNIELYRQIDSIIYQFAHGSKIPYETRRGEKVEVDFVPRKIYGIKVRYIPQLSDIVVNKELQKEQDSNFGDKLLQAQCIVSNPVALRTIYEILIRNQGGRWEEALDKILPPEVQPTPPVNEEEIMNRLKNMGSSGGQPGRINIMNLPGILPNRKPLRENTSSIPPFVPNSPQRTIRGLAKVR